MKKFEYTSVYKLVYDWQNADTVLNSYGSEGWQVVHVFLDGTVIFMRETQDYYRAGILPLEEVATYRRVSA